MLTDAQGNAIPEDDPRLPTPEQTAEVKAAADRLEALLVQTLGPDAGLAEGVKVEASVDALVSLFVPPDETHALRRMFDHRLALNRLQLLQRVAQSIEAARRGPALVVAETVPQGFARG